MATPSAGWRTSSRPPGSPDLVTAARLNIFAGGDCCSRANFIGAVFGARDGIEAIPVEWKEKMP